MIDLTLLRCPRSNYPDHSKKKFDYSRDGNIQAYLNASSKLGINPATLKSSHLKKDDLQHVINQIIRSNDIHERTVYSDILWDGYESYHEAIELIGERILIEKSVIQEKLMLLVKYLKMDKGLNRRPTLGKHYNDIIEDTAYFKHVAERAIFFLDKVSLPKPK